jgi:peptidoglycan/LPS O-acetylase OafA/YrhL
MNTSNNKIDFANTLRGLAALTVLVSHYFGVFWTNREAVEGLINAPILPLEFYAIPKYVVWINYFSLLNWGAYGVALFFIISGFVIPFSLRKYGFSGFLLGRLLRIVPTYVFGFSITLLSIFLCSVWFERDWPFNYVEVLIHYLPGFRDLFGTRNIDGIVWTLEIEMKFYLVCALCISLFRKNSLRIFWIPVFLFFCFIFVNKFAGGLQILGYFIKLISKFQFISQYVIFMFIGVVFNYHHSLILDSKKSYFYICGLFALFCIQWWSGPYAASIFVAWSYGFALLTFMFAYSYPSYFKSNKIFDYFANISYPLYVIHGVTGYVALRIMLDMGFKAWVSLLVVTTVTILLSWLLHVLVEKPSQILGKRLSQKLSAAVLRPSVSST